MLENDKDIKIAGDKPSDSFKTGVSSGSEEFEMERANGNLAKAKELGKKVALALKEACNSDLVNSPENDNNLYIQRILLLSFAATVGFEKFCPTNATATTAQNAFFDHLKAISPKIYEHSCDTGAFSFYFLAYRRGSDIERRIGQTFAMICLHDGDPIFQELGEALYCWFSGVVRKKAKEILFA